MLFITYGGRASRLHACLDVVLLPESYEYPDFRRALSCRLISIMVISVDGKHHTCSQGADSVGGQMHGDEKTVALPSVA